MSRAATEIAKGGFGDEVGSDAAVRIITLPVAMNWDEWLQTLDDSDPNRCFSTLQEACVEDDS